MPPKPPWYSTPTAIAPLPTAISCNSLIESPMDTRQNKSYENIENKSYDNIDDRSDDDNNNNDNDVDYFPW